MNNLNNNHCVVILNYNDWNSCAKLATAIKGFNNIYRIVIVDNCSNDDSVDQLNKVFLYDDKVKVLESGKNGGYSYGNHVGCLYVIEKYKADYITIANPDVMFDETTLDAIIKCISSVGNKVGIVSCMMRCLSEIDLPSAWKLPKYSDCILENLMILRKIVGNKMIYGKKKFSKPIVEVESVAGSFFTISKDAYENIKGFDTATFLYYEENILTKRLKENDYKNYILTNYYYDHMHSVVINNTFKSVKERLKLAYQSRSYYAKRYLKCGKLQMLLLKITFYIGLSDYLLALKILGLKR